MTTRSIRLLFLTGVLMLSLTGYGQQLDEPKPHSPQKAALISALVPGSGQIYNKKFWKAPIVWAGIGVTTYFIIDNTKNYHMFRDEYLARLDGNTINPELDIYSEAGLRNAADTYQRWRDLSYISLAAIYILNIVDAAVDAHLFTFDVGDDLSVNITPFTTPAIHPISGLTFTLKL